MPVTKTSGQGRPKGTPNKLTRDTREAITRLAEATVDQVAEWFNTIAANDPAKALELWLKMLEYHIPKLARTEMTGRDGGPMQMDDRPVLNVIVKRTDESINSGQVKNGRF